jgi:hypothetical protein
MLLVHLQASLAVSGHTQGFIYTVKYAILLAYKFWGFHGSDSFRPKLNSLSSTPSVDLSDKCWQPFLQPVYTNELIPHPTAHFDPEDGDNMFLQNINHVQECLVS